MYVTRIFVIPLQSFCDSEAIKVIPLRFACFRKGILSQSYECSARVYSSFGMLKRRFWKEFHL